MEWLHSGSSWPSQRSVVDEFAIRYKHGKCGFAVPADLRLTRFFELPILTGARNNSRR